MKKFHDIIEKIYGVMMTASFFGGILPLIPFVVALCIGGSTGEAMALFISEKYYPWIIALGSVAVLVGLINVYVKQALDKKEKKTEE